MVCLVIPKPQRPVAAWSSAPALRIEARLELEPGREMECPELPPRNADLNSGDGIGVSVRYDCHSAMNYRSWEVQCRLAAPMFKFCSFMMLPHNSKYHNMSRRE